MAPERTSAAAFPGLRAFDMAPSVRALVGRLPSGRSVAVGFAVAALAGAAYVAARSTSVFAVERVEVRGLEAADSAAVREALRPLEGRSLVTIRREDLQRRIASLPGVLSYEYDRAFPHTLVVTAVPEVPVAVLRRAEESWLVSRRGRVLRRIPLGTQPALPRVWLPRRISVEPGTTLADDAGGSAVRALALLQAAGAGVRARTVRTVGELTYVLRSGLEVRLGSGRAAALKLAVAAQVLPRLDEGASYLDVSVPSRPVAGGEPQVEG